MRQEIGEMGLDPWLPLRLKNPVPDPDPGPGPQNQPRISQTLHCVPKGTVAGFKVFRSNRSVLSLNILKNKRIESDPLAPLKT